MFIEPVKNILDPWDVFLAVSDRQYPFILENQTDAAKTVRFSLVGFDPCIIIKAWQNSIEIIQNNTKEVKTGDPFSILNSILLEYRKFLTTHDPRLPTIFSGGAVGYFGYDLKNLLENLPQKAPQKPFMPDLLFGIYDTMFVYDHNESKGYIASAGRLKKNKLKEFKNIIQKNKTQTSAKALTFGQFASNFTKGEYLSAIKKAKSYISSGDIYQINLSQRFKIPFKGDPKAFYSKLRRIHPVPFGAFLDCGGFQVISNSPECFLKTQNGTIETFPIKGTRPRGKNPAEDEILIKELKTNAKELAEHIMIVDLERNDIGKVCKTGTVKVKELEKIVTYPTLHHMVSCVTGEIKKGISSMDCIKACFPGGSITGAPKIRAMEIIDELEPTPRGIYTGAIGYIDFFGNVNLGMAIRTAVVSNNEMQLSVGGGIVADSVPEDEYEETLLKAEAFFRVIRNDQ